MLKKRLVLPSIIFAAAVSIVAGYIFFHTTTGYVLPQNTNSTEKTQTSVAPKSSNLQKSETPVNSKNVENPAGKQKPGDSSKAIIYNTHPYEKFKSGETIPEVAKSFEEKLNKNGVPCLFVNNTNNSVKDSYKVSRDLLSNNVSDFSGKILLDLLTGENTPIQQNDILIWVCKGNVDFIKNQTYALNLLKEVNTLDKSISIQVLVNNWTWNQDLSGKAVSIIVGNNDSPPERIEKCLEVFSTAIKNVESQEE